MYCEHCGNKLQEGAGFCQSCGKSTKDIVNEINKREVLSDATNYHVAPSEQRFLNLLIDLIGLIAFSFVIGLILGVIGLGEAMQNFNTTLFGLLILVLYYILFESIWQRTPGKFITSTKVMARSGEKPTFGQIIGRSFARLIPFEAFSFFDSLPYGWHDKFSGTVVVPQNYSPEEIKSISIVEENVRTSKTAWIVLIIFCVIIVLGVAMLYLPALFS